jgi:hypothetical protein
MTKLCKIYRPHIAWLFKLDTDLHDHVYMNTEECVNYLAEKYKITYDDIDVIISTDFVEDYDIKMDFYRLENNFPVFLWNDIECRFGIYFEKWFNLNEHTKNLYFKVIPLIDL